MSYILDGVTSERGFVFLEYVVDVRVPTVEYRVAHSGRRFTHHAVIFLGKQIDL